MHLAFPRLCVIHMFYSAYFQSQNSTKIKMEIKVYKFSLTPVIYLTDLAIMGWKFYNHYIYINLKVFSCCQGNLRSPQFI